MLTKPLLIVGLDPGTTLGYALLDLKGQVLKINSLKEHKLSSLITSIISLGLPVITATDVHPSPSLVQQFHRKMGTHLISPPQDLKISEKKQLVKNHSFKDPHQRDALAAALFAFKKIRPLMEKTNRFLKRKNKPELSQKIKKLLLTHPGLSLQAALALLTQKKPETKLIKKIIQEKKYTQKDFFPLYNQFTNSIQTNQLLEKQNSKLKNKIKDLKKVNQFLLHQSPDKKAKQQLDFKEKRILLLTRELKAKEQQIINLKQENKKLQQFLLNSNNQKTIKKLNNLGKKEFAEKDPILKIKPHDCLLINDPNIFSPVIIEKLKNKNITLLYKKPLNKKTKALPFTFINAQNLTLEENHLFALIPKQELEKQINKSPLLKKIIQEYKHEQNRKRNL